MPTVLVTGANRGLGLEYARQYAADGWQVIGTCRNPGSAEELAGTGARVVQLDVADPTSVRAMKEAVGDAPIDVLINNAGIGGDSSKQTLGSLDADELTKVLRVNAVGQLVVSEALLPNVSAAAKASGQAVIAATTSGMGSIGDNDTGGQYAYRMSKTALNMAMHVLSIDVAKRGIVCAVLCPGWVRTDMGGSSARLSPEESVKGLRKVIAGLTREDNGRFYRYNGVEVPW